MELPFEYLPIWKVEFTLTFFTVIFELTYSKSICTFVSEPKIIDYIKVLIVVLAIQLDWAFIIKDSKSLELISNPISFIGNFTFFIEQSSMSIHQSIFKIAFIVGSIRVGKFSGSISNPIDDNPFILAAILIVFNDEEPLLFYLFEIVCL